MNFKLLNPVVLLLLLLVYTSCDKEQSITVEEHGELKQVEQINNVRIFIYDETGNQPNYRRLKLRAINTKTNEVYKPERGGRDFIIPVGTYLFKGRSSGNVQSDSFDLSTEPANNDGIKEIYLFYKDDPVF